MKIVGIIPARYASTRFPAKALADIAGIPMVVRVWMQACKSKSLSQVIVATDHQQIFDVITAAGGTAIMTDSELLSGTDRCAQVLLLASINPDFVINIQGDEPFIEPEQIDLLASSLTDKTQIATLIKKIENPEQIFNANIVKVVVSSDMNALYFSRAAVPYIRDVDIGNWHNSNIYYRHIGIYAYRTGVLSEITKLPISVLEQSEALEQLRWLDNSYRISCVITPYESIGIDTVEDLKNALMRNNLV